MKRHFNAKFDIATEKRICKLYLEGVHYGSVRLAKMFGCNNGTILAVLKKNGVKVRSNSESQRGLQVGIAHPNFKGGNISLDGYKRIYVNKCLVQEHRHIMSVYLGRKLKNSEIVHHINENKLDNRVENLEIMTRAEHGRHHGPVLVANLQGRKNNI